MTRTGLIKRLVVCSVLGLVTTVFVAWGFSRRQLPSMRGLTRYEHFVGDRRDGVFVAYTDASVPGVRIRVYDRDSRSLYRSRTATRLETVDRIDPGWGLGSAGLLQRIDPPQPRTGGTTVIGTGFPMIALWQSQDHGMWEDSYVGALVFYRGWPTKPRGLHGPRVALPFLPIWPGVLVDTGFWAGFWALPVFGSSCWRRRRRRRHGRCMDCGYDLCGSIDGGCPECGWGRSDTEG